MQWVLRFSLPRTASGLDRLSRSSSARHRTMQRAKALATAADGVAEYEIARRVGVSANLARRTWRVGSVIEGQGLRRNRSRPRPQVVAAGGHGWRRWSTRFIPDPTTAPYTRDDALMGARHGIGKDSWHASGGTTAFSRGGRPLQDIQRGQDRRIVALYGPAGVSIPDVKTQNRRSRPIRSIELTARRNTLLCTQAMFWPFARWSGEREPVGEAAE